MKTEEVLFVSECECCDYSSAEFDCPSCNKYIRDYDLGWMKDDLYDGEIVEEECSKCKSLLLFSYNREEYEYQVVTK